MNAIHLAALVLFTLGVFSYGAMTLLWIGSLVRPGSDGPARRMPECFKPGEIVGGVMAVVCFVWFGLNLVQELVMLNPEFPRWGLGSIILFIAFLFPPLILHTSYAEGLAAVAGSGKEDPLPPLPRVWRYVTVIFYLVSPATALVALAGFWQILPIEPRTMSVVATTALGIFFTLAMVLSFALSLKYKKKKKETREERTGRRFVWGLMGFAILIFFLLTFHGFGNFPFSSLVHLIARSMPLFFLFVITYFENRFEFFDIFVKRGIGVLLTLVILTLWFALTLPWLEGRVAWFGISGPGTDLGWARPWAFAILLLPPALALPWAYRRLADWLDAAWLGRRFRPVEAVKFFLSSLQSATSEPQLVDRAEAGLAEIFHAPVRIGLGLREAEAPEFEPVQEIPVRTDATLLGVIRFGPRTGQTPFLSEDLALAGSLAEVFCYLLQNVRLQEREQEQKRHTRELTLQASRSELKALRAQINPHFLFNALNAIAGLIHKNPLQADRTVERLADVFRYTLRRSESEWTQLQEELEFVRSYLEVEKARFGERLEFRIESETGIDAAKIPSMAIQTLVENAVKHGIAAVRRRGRIEIRASRESGRLQIEVSDNGPGFPAAGEATGRDGGRGGSGYGLHNVRERLQGHFGNQAELIVGRDDGRGMTVVTIRIPLRTDPRKSRLQARGEGGDPGGAA